MPPLPDRFDLFIRKARESSEGSRQVDYCLGTLFGQPEWFFLNQGSTDRFIPALAQWEGGRYLVVFSSTSKLRDILEEEADQGPSPAVSVPVSEAAPFCLQFTEAGVGGILVNPGAYAFAADMETLDTFHTAWHAAGGPKGIGFWIPNTTSEEDDFWDELGVA